MKNTSLTEAPKVPIEFEGYVMHKSSSLEIIHLCLHPGQTIAQHPNASDVVACLIEGEVTLDMGEIHTVLNLYDVAAIEMGAPRGFTNTGTGNARMLIMKKQ